MLAEVLCEDIAARSGALQMDLAPEALALLQAQAWRGNIRELRNVLEQVALRTDDHHIDGPTLAGVLRSAGLEQIAPPAMLTAEPAPVAGDLLRPLAEQVAELERRAMRAALARTGGNRAAAARLLGMSRASFYDKLDASE
jgi:DNA-binding NtrC family response regulator